MSEDLFYNRDVNLSGIDTINISDYTPSYGSSVSFSNSNHVYKTLNNYYNCIPLSVNSLAAKFNVKYELPESDTQKVVNFFEQQSGVNDFEYQPDSSVYRNLSGFCLGYGINHINQQHYELTANIEVIDAPNLLNWSGGTFVSGAWNPYALSTSYQKYDVVYTGVNTNKLNNFYYCTGDHSSTADNSPTGNNSMWTQAFFFEPDIGFNNSVTFDINEVNFKNSNKTKIKTNQNISTFPVAYTFSSISTNQLKSMLHFLENHAGYRRFRHQIPSVYNRPKVFYCSDWTHTWKYYNCHDLTLTLIEDPLGVIPTST